MAWSVGGRERGGRFRRWRFCECIEELDFTFRADVFPGAVMEKSCPVRASV